MYWSPVRGNPYRRFVEWSYRGPYPLVAVASGLLWSLAMSAMLALSFGIAAAGWVFMLAWPAMSLVGYFLGPLRYRRKTST